MALPVSPERARQVETRFEPLDAHWTIFHHQPEIFAGRTWVLSSLARRQYQRLTIKRNLKLLGSPLAAGRARGRRSERFEPSSWLHDAVAYRRDPFTGSMCFYWQGKSTHSAKQARKLSSPSRVSFANMATRQTHKGIALRRACDDKSPPAATLVRPFNEPDPP